MWQRCPYLHPVLKIAFLLALWMTLSTAQTQQTVGVFINEPEAFTGYTLFSPSSAHNTYLIDNCGRQIHQWPGSHTPGQSVYLLTDGSITRTARITSAFLGGGSGGRIENISWDGDLIWAYNYSSANVHQHHDIEPMPNGNILVLAWERKSRAEAIEAGCNPAAVPQQGLWPDHIVELEPIGAADAEIVWEWHAWDHLIQDFDSSRPGFGVIGDHPERIDLNYPEPMFIDWLHCNSIDYEPTLDQILISVHSFSEIWIIDHSTTTDEAAGSTGGNYGRGGDLLYRWGNPHAYDRGAQDERIFGGQHDARWIEPGVPGEGQISVFNNSHGAGQDLYSSADFFLPLKDTAGMYVLSENGRYGPDSLSWSFHGMPDNSFYSARLSGVQRLPNGNTLICIGNLGKFIEVTSAGGIVWEYVSPLSGDNSVQQGSNPVLNDIFRAERYPVDYESFDARNLMPGEPLELNPLPLICNDTLLLVTDFSNFSEIFFAPNPVSDLMYLSNPKQRSVSIDIFAGGRLCERFSGISVSQFEIGTDSWPPGLILIVCTDEQTMKFRVIKLLKL